MPPTVSHTIKEARRAPVRGAGQFREKAGQPLQGIGPVLREVDESGDRAAVRDEAGLCARVGKEGAGRLRLEQDHVGHAFEELGRFLREVWHLPWSRQPAAPPESARKSRHARVATARSPDAVGGVDMSVICDQ